MKRNLSSRTVGKICLALAYATMVILALGGAFAAAARQQLRAEEQRVTVCAPPVLKPMLHVWFRQNCGPCHQLFGDYETDPAFRQQIDRYYAVVHHDADQYPISTLLAGINDRTPYFYCRANGVQFSGYTTKADLLKRLRLDGSQAMGNQNAADPNYIPRPITLQPQAPAARQPIVPPPAPTPQPTNVPFASSEPSVDPAELTRIREAIESLKSKVPTEAIEAARAAIREVAPHLAETVAASGGTLAFLAPLAGLLGLTPAGAGIGAAGALAWALRAGWKVWKNRGSGSAGTVTQRTITQQVGVPIRYDAIPSPQIVQQERIVVPIEKPSREVAAYQWALDEYSRKFPGSEGAVNLIESYKTQFLKSPAG